ncbi:DNA gyrase/topoisomerase IV subunit A [Streptomyces sp. NBC_01262]|uniref:DNA gyrase/topoisomerase IV subunit A n=1 Tax=Streptomyces sp. NBC_01262 TaxID=2903803 RepID=UPI002E35E032|nr:DNA topoisomerase IV subunit A [Streptomyces sp. NBC_01262]
MARRTTKTPPPDDFEERILDIDVVDEMQGSFLEYAYSVIYSRALPDARDGLKPVHRRIVYQMNEMGLRPERGYVKCARVVGEVMGRLHPHGDSSIYDAMVRLAQPFSMRVPLVDGHGNFGSLDDMPAAMRYTESRMSGAAQLMVESIDEDTVDFAPNYDGQEQEPGVLPAAYPNLLVNGASGIAVGMATNMPPHNLGEVIAAARHLIRFPNADLDALMRFVPGPDLPTGGRIIGLGGIRDAYENGRGTFKIRATVSVEDVSARRKGLVVTELPFTVGPEKVIAKIKDLVGAKKLQGIADVKDLTDREHGLRLVIEIKNGFNPEAVLEQLYKLTPMEDSFGINNVALVDGQPLTLGLKELLEVYVDHRFDVVRRRSEFRRRKRQDRLHLVAGLLVALVDIDEVISIIRSSDNAAAARDGLIERFSLSDIQTQYILDTPLRRLTRFDRIELESERDRLTAEIEELTRILDSDSELRKMVSTELAAVAKKYGTERRTVLLESAGAPVAAVPLEVADDPCRVLLSSTGLLARTMNGEAFESGDGKRSKHDAIVSAVPTTARADIGAVTTTGRLLRITVIDLPQLPDTAGAPNLAGGAPVSEFLSLETGEKVLCLTTLDESSPGLALGTEQGVVKRVVPDYPANKDDLEVIGLKDGDVVIGAVELRTGEEDLVFITDDAQLLRYPASQVRPQGRPAGGMAGIKLAEGAKVISFTAVDPATDAVVVTVAAADPDTLDGAEQGTAKLTPFELYPRKGRATGGVRCQRFLRGETSLAFAWAGPTPARAATAAGLPADLPPKDPRRDGSGIALTKPVAVVAGPV